MIKGEEGLVLGCKYNAIVLISIASGLLSKMGELKQDNYIPKQGLTGNWWTEKINYFKIHQLFYSVIITNYILKNCWLKK